MEDKKFIIIPTDETKTPVVTSEIKAECNGEFSWKEEVTEHDDEGYTEVVMRHHTVPWTVCKDIYKKMAMAAAKGVRINSEEHDLLMFSIDKIEGKIARNDVEKEKETEEIKNELKTFPTKKLLRYLQETRIEGNGHLPYLAEALKKELDTREHIPNKIESKKIRQEKAVHGRNR